MASSRYDSVAMTETGLAREGGFGQRDRRYVLILSSLVGQGRLY